MNVYIIVKFQYFNINIIINLHNSLKLFLTNLSRKNPSLIHSILWYKRKYKNPFLILLNSFYNFILLKNIILLVVYFNYLF